MCSDITIRRMRLRDFPRVLAIERQCFPLNSSLGPMLYYWLVDRDGLMVAEHGAEVVGYVFTRRTAMGAITRYGHVASLAVEGAFRRRGIGRRLMDAALAHFARRGLTTVGLEVRQSNTAAQVLYGKLGFEPNGSIKRYYADGEDALRMLKHFTPEELASGSDQCAGEARP